MPSVDIMEVEEDSEYLRQRRKNIEELQFLLKTHGIHEAVQDLENHSKEVSAKKDKLTLKRKWLAPRKLKLDPDWKPRVSLRIRAIQPIHFESLDFDGEDERKKQKKSFNLKVNLKQRETSLPKFIEEPVEFSEFDSWVLEEKIQFYGYSEVDANNSSGLKEILKQFEKTQQFVEVSDTKLKHITYKSSCKIYDSESGTTCHQCRQKTVDTKSFCRWPLCRGVRGQFCGFCLKIRYGEDLKEVLKNPEWKCPPCRAICNCSICRNREGKAATGILAYVAEKKGFESVHQLLKHEEKLKCNSKSELSDLQTVKNSNLDNKRVKLSGYIERLKTLTAGLEEYGKGKGLEEEISTRPQQSTKLPQSTERHQSTKVSPTKTLVIILKRCDEE